MSDPTMNAESNSGNPSPIIHTLADTHKDNNNSFNTTSNTSTTVNNNWHIYAATDGYPSHQRHRRGASAAPTLPPTPEEFYPPQLIATPSQTPKFPRLPHETTQVSDEYEITIPVESNHGFKSESIIHQASTSQVQHTSRRTKSHSIIGRISSFSRTVLGLNDKRTREQKLYTELNTKNVGDYLPKNIDEKYKNYICSPHLDQVNAIPVWDPSTPRGEGIRGRIRIDVGDVGTFTMRGGFRVEFNILLDAKTNDLCGYNVPENFSPFMPPLNSEQAQSCRIKYDPLKNMIDLDKCGAIYADAIDFPDPLSYGMKQGPCKPSQDQRSPLFEISPQATKDPRRGFLYLPYGAKIYTFSPRARQNLKPYLKEQLPNWLQHLNGLREQQRALPIILTAVWASRSLACASYRISPPNTSATLQLLKDLDGEKVEWARAPEGFSTHIAPLASEGYDQYGRLKSNVEDQSFAIEGYGVLKKEIA